MDPKKIYLSMLHLQTLAFIPRLRAANPSMKVILYWPWGLYNLPAGVGESGVLHGTDGRRSVGPNGELPPNFGDPSFQDWLIGELRRLIQLRNLDGIHWDGPPQVGHLASFPGVKPKPNPAEYANWATQLVRLGDGLTRMLNGKVFDTESVGQDWFGWSTDGSEDYWRRWNTGQMFVVGIPTEGEKCAFAFRVWNKLHSLGKGMNPILFGGDAKTQPVYMPWWFAFYMIMQDGPHDYIGSEQFPEFEKVVKAQPWADPVRIGKPLGPYTKSGSVLTREYEGVRYSVDLDRPYQGARITMK